MWLAIQIFIYFYYTLEMLLNSFFDSLELFLWCKKWCQKFKGALMSVKLPRPIANMSTKQKRPTPPKSISETLSACSFPVWQDTFARTPIDNQLISFRRSLILLHYVWKKLENSRISFSNSPIWRIECTPMWDICQWYCWLRKRMKENVLESTIVF